MKFLTTLISAMSAPAAEGSMRALLRLLGVLIVSVALFSVGFHEIMELEGRRFSWPTSVYWTVVTMSTLGYGDITFESDLGRMYSLVVLFAGSILILVLLPFTFIQVVYLPWRTATRQVSAPRSLPRATRGHVVLTALEPVAEALITRLTAAGIPYALLVEDVDRGVALHDAGVRVAVGDIDDPATYRSIRADQAGLLFTAQADETNTNIVSTWREVATDVPVVATAKSADAVDILELVGADRVLRLEEALGSAFARRILAPTAQSTVVATFDDLVVAEASASGTTLVGRSLQELGFRRRFGLSVIGVWDRGKLHLPSPDLVVEEESILVLLGTRAQLDHYDSDAELGNGERSIPGREGPVLILGGGRVGRATARALDEAGTDFRIVERDPSRVLDDPRAVTGDAADRDVLHRAGIDDAPAVIVTTHDDDTNIYLTLYCRRLRPDVEILGRVTNDRNLSTMHRAGADLVLSYASIGATEVWNTLRGEATLLLAEGLLLFRAEVPAALGGRALRDTEIRAATGCTVVGVVEDGRTRTDIGPGTVLPAGGRIMLVGDGDAEERFLRRYIAETEGVFARLRRLVGPG